jgi:hypothetical protein
MPTQTFEAVVASHLRTATHRPMDEQTLATYLDQWKGATGQKLYLQKDALLNEDDTAEFEPLLPSITVPLRIVWGENDAWLPPPPPNACTSSSQAPTSCSCPTPATSPRKTAPNKSPQPSSISSSTAPVPAKPTAQPSSPTREPKAHATCGFPLPRE